MSSPKPSSSRRPSILTGSAADLFEIQSLENRLLFSANNTAVTDATLAAAAVTGLDSGLADLVKIGGALDDYGALGDDLSGVGESIGGLFDFGSLDAKGGFLQTELVQPLVKSLVGGTTKASEVTTFLTSLAASAKGGYDAVSTKSVTGGFFAATNEFEWDFVLSGTKSATFKLDAGADLATEGLSFSSLPDVTIATNVDFHFSFGVKADGTGFFLTLTQLDFGANADTGNTLNFKVGFDDGASLKVVNGSLAVDAQIDGMGFNVTPDANGRIKGAELAKLTDGLAVGEVTLDDLSGSLHAKLPLNALATGFPTVFVDVADIFSATAPDVSLKFYLTDAALQQNILDLLGTMDTAVTAITGNAVFKTTLPLIDKSLGDLLATATLTDLLSFESVAETYFDSTLEPEVTGLVAALTTHAKGLATLAGSAFDFAYDALNSDLQLNFDLEATPSATLNLPLDRFGAAGAAMGLTVPDTLAVNVSATAKAAFTVGLDLSDGAIDGDHVYLSVDDISASVTIDSNLPDFGVNVGPIAAKVVGGTVDLSAKATVIFDDPNDDGRITFNEFDAAKTTLTPSGSVDVNLPLVMEFGGYDFKVKGVDPKVRIFSDNPFTTAPKIDVTTPNFDRLFNLGRMGPAEVLDLMIAAGDWADQFRDADVFAIDIPFLNDTDFGDVFDFGLLFAKNLRDKLSINEVQLFSALTAKDFAKSALTLAADTPFLLVLDDATTAAPTVSVKAGTYKTVGDWAKALNTALDAAYGGDAPVEASVYLGGDRKAGTDDDRVLLTSDPDELTGFSLVAPFTNLKALAFYSGTTTAAFTAPADAIAQGKLTADAKFTVTINGAAPVLVTVAKTATDANTSIANLAADVQAALTTAGITTLTVTTSSNRLVFTGDATVTAFMIGGEGSSAWDQLGLGEANTAGIGGIGSQFKTGPAFATFQELVPLLEEALGLPEDTLAASYDPATETIRLGVQFGYNPDPIEVPVSFDLKIGDIAGVKIVDADGNDAPLTIKLTPKMNAELTFGYSFNPATTVQRVSVAPGIGYVTPAGYDEDAKELTPLDWNGRLGNDATFTIILDDATARTLTVAKSATTTNTSVADLVKDINDTIAKTAGLTGKITATLLDASGETADRVQISTVAGQSRSMQIKVTDGNAAMTELGFGKDSFGQASDNGLSVVSLASSPAKVVLSKDANFYIGLDGGAPVKLTLAKNATTTNTTMSDLLADLNAAIGASSLSGQVQAVRFGAGNRVQFAVVGSARTMTFDTDANDGASADLGFSVEPVSLRKRGGEFFVEDAKLTAEATLEVEDLRLAAQLGFLGITTGDSGGSITLSAEIELKDEADNTRFTIGGLFDALAQGSIGDLVQFTKHGEADFELTDIKVDAGLFVVPGSPTIGFVIDELFPTNGGLTITPVFENMPSLTNFKKLDFTTIFLGVKQAVDILSTYDDFEFLNYRLPVVNLSAVEILDYADKLRVAIEEIEANPAEALQMVEAKIEEALGLPPSLVTLSIDGPNLDVVKISLNVQANYTGTFGLNLDLTDLEPLFAGGLAAGWETITGLIDASAEGNIDVAAYAKATIDLGIDISAGFSDARSFLYDTSGVELGLRFAGRNLELTAAIGVVGLAITDGSVLLDSDGVFDQYDKSGNLVAGGDGVIDDDYATIRMGLKDNAEPGFENDGRHYLTEDFTFEDDFAVTYQGRFKAVLPPSLITPLGNIDLDSPVEIYTTADDFAALIQRTPGATPIHISVPSLEGLLPETPGIIQLLRDPSILLSGVDNVLYKIQQGLDSQTSQKLPLIGNRLSEGAQMIEEFREGFLADLTEKLRGAGDSLLEDLREMMFDFFGPGGDLNILADLNGDDDITGDDVVLTFRKSDGSLWVEGTDAPKLQDAVEFNIRLGQEYIAEIPDLKLDFALPGLELKVSGSPSVSFDWNMYLGFGVSLTDLFYVNSKPTDDGLPKADDNEYVDAELKAEFNVRLTTDEANPFTATGTLFFLQLQARDEKLTEDNKTSGGDTNFSVFNGTFTVQLNDPGVGTKANDRVQFTELFKRGGAIKVFEAGLSAKADINLDLDLSVQGSKVIPRVLADFNLDWSWSLADGASPVKAGFNNVALDLGSFISDFLKPIADKINDIIKPFDPVLDALQTRIPVLSDLMGRDYTLLDLAVTFGKVDRRFIDAVLAIRGLIADIAALPAGQSIIIPIGSIADFGSSLMQKGGAKNVDPASYKSVSTTLDTSTAPSSATNILNKSKSVSGGGFGFPILKPANVFKLLMGQDVVLFTYDIPRLEVGMSMSARFSIFGPLVATFSGRISAYADFAVGFDTKGLNQFKVSGDPLDILDGFYVSDRANADGTGADVPEAGFVGRIDIGGAVNLAVVEAGISGFFQISANLDLNDPNDDGKIRGSEIIALLKYTTPDGKNYGPLNLGSITLKGEVGARAYVDVFALFSWETVWEYEFFRATIFEKTFSAPRPQPVLATVGTGGVLNINAGSSANQRAFGSTTDVGESFTLTDLGGGQIKVRFNNTETEQTISGVSKIYFNAGKGNDVLDARGLTIAVEFYGGEGDDVLYAGNGGSYLDGGDGNDELYGGSGKDVFSGGKGADIIEGGGGDDVLEGGAGNDQLEGGLGNDTYVFGDGWGVDSLLFLGGEDGAKSANQDTFDFTKAAAALTISIGANQSKVTSGKNSVTADDSVGELKLVLGGSGGDSVNVNSSSTAGITVDGGKGADSYSVGFGRLVGAVTITDSSTSTTDDDTVYVEPVAKDPIDLYDAKLISTRSGGVQEQVNFTGLESLVVTAPSNVVKVQQALTFDNNVRIKGSTIVVQNTIDAGYIRVDSGNAIKIDADLNARANGNIEVVVNKGDIQINANVWSSAGKGTAAGDGAGVLQLISRGGQIVTDGTGTVRADDGFLLLQGSTGSIGTTAQPILTQVMTLAAKTTGTGVINIHESDGVIIGEVAVIQGISSNGGDINILNDSNSLTFEQPASANGGDMIYTSDQVQVNADLSTTGDLLLQPKNPGTAIAIGDGVDALFDLNTSEIGHLVDGLDSLRIGRADGSHAIYIEDVTFTDPTTIQNPILGGHVYQTGEILGVDNASLTILGSGHTTDLDDQDVLLGNIDILDSVRVRAGESVRLEADAGNININFDLDGFGAGTMEKLTLNAPGGTITIKGNIGSFNVLDELVIENALSVRFEGTVNVGKLTITNVGSFTVDGAVTADMLELLTVGIADFNSAITATSITHPSGVLGIATFEGAVTAPTISLTATSLLDFYQNVGTTTLTLETTGLTGDILLRQQVNATGTVTVESLDDITFQGPVTAAALTVATANDLAFQSTLNVSGTLTQTTGTGLSTFGSVNAGSVDLTAAALVFNSSLTGTGAAGSVLLNATAGDVSITGVTNAANIFTATASGNVTFLGNATGKTVSLDATNLTFGNLTATTGGSLTIEAAATGTITATGATTSAGALTISRAANVSLAGAINVSGAFTQSEALGFATGTTSLGQVSAGSIDLRATNLTFNSTVTASTGGIALKAGASGNIAVTGALTANSGALTVTQAASVTFSAQVNVQSANVAASQFITVANSAAFATTGTATLTTTDALIGEIKLTGAFAVGGFATVTGARSLSFLGSVEAAAAAFTAATTINLGTSSVTTTSGDLVLITTTAGAGNGVTASGPFDIADDFIVTTPRALALNGSIEAAALNFDAASITLPGTVETKGNVTLLAANTGNINLGSTINAGGAFTVNRVRDLTFGGLVTADSISVGVTEARVITVGTSGLSTTNNLTLRSTSATGSLAMNGPLTSADGTLTLSAVGNINTGAALAANRIVASGANLAFSGALNADGVAPGVRGIVIDTAANGSGTVGFGSTVTTADTLTVGGTNRPLSVTFSGTLNTAVDALLNATETITLNNPVNAGRDLSLNTTSASAGEIRLVGAVMTGRDLLVNTVRDAFFQAAVSIGRDLRITAVDDVQFQTSLNVTGAIVQTAGTGTATYAALSGASIDIAANAITVTNGVTTTTGDALFTAGLAGDVNIGGTVTVVGLLEVDRADDVSFAGAVGATTVNIGGTQVRTIAFGNNALTASGDITLAANAGAGAITLSGPVTSTNATLTLTALGTLSTAALEANRLVVSAANANFSGAVKADGVAPGVNGIVIDAATAAAGSVSFGSTLNSSASVIIGASKRPQMVTLAGTVNVTDDLAITSAETLTANSGVTAGRDLAATTTSTTAGEVRFVGAVSAGNDLRLSAARDAFFQAAVTASHDLTITTVDDVQFQAALTVTNLLTQQAGTGTATYASILTGAAVINSANIVVTNGLTTTFGDAVFNAGVSGDVTLGGAVSVTGELEVERADDVSFTGAVLANVVTIGSTQVRTATFGNGGVTATNNLVVNATAANGAITFTGAAQSVNGVLTATTTGVLTATGAVKADRVVASAATMNFASTLEADGLGASKGIVLDATAAGVGTIALASTVTSADSITIGATTRPANVIFSGGIVAGNDLAVTAAETITFTGAVNVTDDVTLTTTSATAGELRALGTVNIGGDLLLSAARDVTFQAAATIMGNATITAADDLQFQAALTVTGTLTQETGTGVSSFANVLAGDIDLEAKSLQVTGSVTSQIGATQLRATGGNVTITGTTTSAAALTIHDGVSVSLGGKVTATQMLLQGGVLIASSDLIATTGSITILVTGDVTVGGETRAALDEIVIDGSEDVTLNGAVTAEKITVNTASLNAAGTVTATAGDLTLTTTGDIAITGATTASGSIEVTQAQSVTLSGAVSALDFTLHAASFLAGNTLTTTAGSVDLTTTGNIRVVGLATIADDLIIRGAANVTFQGQTLVTDRIEQLNGTATTRFEGVTQAASIALKTAQQILAGSTFRALTSDIVLESDEIDFIGGTNTVQGNAQLILRSYLAATTIDIGSPTPTGTLDLSDVDLNALRDGFTQIIIGRAEDATGAMLIGSSIFKDNVAFHAGSIVVESNTLVGQQVSTLESLEMTARTGGITINDDVDATDIVLTARDHIAVNSTVQSQDFTIVTAGTDGSGNITVSATGTLEGTAPGSDVTITAGATTGNIQSAGLIAAKDDMTLTAASGAITQTAGNTAAADLVATAQSGITLLTTVDHLKARVTGAGDLTITDINPNLAHFINLGSATDVNDGLFTADGDIRVTANANGNAYRVEANGGVFLNFGGEIFVGTVNGSPSQITGTILIDEDRITNGEDITFNGNVRLLRDITFTSNGGDITITGRVSGTVGSNFGLTLNAGTGDVFVGGPIGFDVLSDAPLGFLTVTSANNVVFGDEATDLAAIRVLGNIEIHSNDVEFNAPAGSVRTMAGGELRFLPLDATAAIDLGAPLGGTANYALGDDDLVALGNGFSLITIGQVGGDHAINLESAQFRDSLVLNGDRIAFLASGTPQGVNGLSVVNGNDDNSITINAQTSFTQGRRAAISAGRYGDITITADTIELDGRSANVIRGFGHLVLQPFSAAQAITLGTAGSATDFDLTTAELGTLADGFRSITIGRANGEHAIVIGASLSFRDATTIQAPLGAGSMTIGAGSVTPITVRTLGKGDALTLKAAGNVTIDAKLATAGSGALTVHADADASGAGDLLFGQNAIDKTPLLSMTTEQGALNLRGENVRLGVATTINKKLVGQVALTSKTGNVSILSNLDNDSDGAVEFRNAKTALTTLGTLEINSNTASVLVDSARLIAAAGIDIATKSEVMLTTKALLQSNPMIRIVAGTNLTLMTGTQLVAKIGLFELRADRNDATLDGNVGLLTLGDAVKLTAKTVGTLSAFQLQRSASAFVKATTVTEDIG